MGYEIANNAYLKGSIVTIVSGPVNFKAYGGIKVIDTISALDMFNAVKDNYKDMDFIIMSVDVADYNSKIVANNKFKKSDDD